MKNTDGQGQARTEDERLIPKHGGFRNLKSFQVSEVIYDVTVRFCEKYVDRFSRTKDQMVQAARSGRQNIAKAFEEEGGFTERLYRLRTERRRRG